MWWSLINYIWLFSTSLISILMFSIIIPRVPSGNIDSSHCLVSLWHQTIFHIWYLGKIGSTLLFAIIFQPLFHSCYLWIIKIGLPSIAGESLEPKDMLQTRKVSCCYPPFSVSSLSPIHQPTSLAQVSGTQEVWWVAPSQPFFFLLLRTLYSDPYLICKSCFLFTFLFVFWALYFFWILILFQM